MIRSWLYYYFGCFWIRSRHFKEEPLMKSDDDKDEVSNVDGCGATEVRALSLNLLVEMTDNFSENFLIGEGSYGRVYYTILDDMPPMALKRLRDVPEPESEKEFMGQVSLATRLKHGNFVDLIGYCVEDNNRLLAYEYSKLGSLHDILHGRKSELEPKPGPLLDWDQRVKIAVDAARGLEYLHKFQPCIVHGDVRSSNVLLFENYKAKIADFNISKRAPDMTDRLCSSHLLGTFSYRAPEYTLNGQFTWQNDVYGFGVVLLELLTGRKPMDLKRPEGQHSLIVWATPRLSEERVMECVDPRLKGGYNIQPFAQFAAIAAECLQFDYQLRPDMSGVLKQLQLLLPVRYQQVDAPTRRREPAIVLPRCCFPL